jgi:serine/threonine-protein kinase RsbT
MRSLKQEESVAIKKASDIVAARQKGRVLAAGLGFSLGDATLIATAISELARNMLLYAGGGELILQEVYKQERRGITMVARDSGPGIADIRRAMTGGFSTSGGLGLGLSGVRRLMDEMDVQSEAGHGTKVVATIWLR